MSMISDLEDNSDNNYSDSSRTTWEREGSKQKGNKRKGKQPMYTKLQKYESSDSLALLSSTLQDIAERLDKLELRERRKRGASRS